MQTLGLWSLEAIPQPPKPLHASQVSPWSAKLLQSWKVSMQCCKLIVTFLAFVILY